MLFTAKFSLVLLPIEHAHVAAPLLRGLQKLRWMVYVALVTLTACGGGGDSRPTIDASGTVVKKVAALSVAAQLGEQIFHDRSLSGSGKMACATCHVPTKAHGPTGNQPVSLGGISLTEAGTRAAPSLRYLQLTPAFSFDKNGTPAGGFNRDGRAATLALQALRPFLAAHEMANLNANDVSAKLAHTDYADAFRKNFGIAIFDHPEQALEQVGLALQQYQKENPEFFPFDAKYDQFLAGRVSLTATELRGLQLFNDRNKGNCAACHPSGKSASGALPLFTDFSYDNIGVPRNPLIPANADTTYADLGLCGPLRQDLRERAELCGKFKVPTLRNITTRQVFFHNGRFTNLRDVLGFYVRRDTNPEEWYPRLPDGSINKFDDLPEAYRANVNVSEGPYNRKPGDAPALSPAEIEDVIAFLGTLTDGYKVTN